METAENKNLFKEQKNKSRNKIADRDIDQWLEDVTEIISLNLKVKTHKMEKIKSLRKTIANNAS
jgi:hypothetical protein